MTYTTKEVTNGSLKYRIEVRQLADSSWQQRHIWIETPSTPRTEQWISIPRGMGEHFSQRPDVRGVSA